MMGFRLELEVVMIRFLAIVTLLVLVPGPAAAAGGDVEVTPYGFILVNGGISDRIATDIPFRANLTDSGDARTTFLLTARQTRVGLRLSADRNTWSASGSIELDFWGRKGSAANGASMQSAPRLRLAFFTLKKDRVSLLFGQNWTIFAPLSPNSLAHVSIPPLSGSGNLWNRMPQIRIDYTFPAGDQGSILLQAAAVRPIAADATGDGQAELLGAGEHSGLPFGQARLAWVESHFTFGVSTHVGQEDWQQAYPDSFFTDKKTKTWAVAADAQADVSVLGISAEAFTGTNLGMLFSGAGVDLLPVPAEPGAVAGRYDVEGMDVIGGWGQIAIRPAGSKVQFHGGTGIEVLDQDQVDLIVELTEEPEYQKNLTLFGNVFFTPLQAVTVALEVGYIRTTYRLFNGTDIVSEDISNVHISGGFKLGF